jgi:hypothetical protein
MQSEMPRAGAAHREAAQHDSSGIDRVVQLNRRERLEQVRFARPSVRHVGSTERLELNVVLVCRDRAIALLLGDERDLVQRSVGAVLPDVEAHRSAAVVRVGDRQPVRLHAAVDSRHVAAHDMPFARRPRWFSAFELARALESGLEDASRVGDEARAGEFLRELEDVRGGPAVDVDVGEQIRISLLRAERIDACGQVGELLFNVRLRAFRGQVAGR